MPSLAHKSAPQCQRQQRRGRSRHRLWVFVRIARDQLFRFVSRDAVDRFEAEASLDQPNKELIIH